jgi:hypothetical protein
MEVAIIFALVGAVVSLMSISIAHAYRVVVEVGIKKQILGHKEVETHVPVNSADDLQQRLEQFRRERFAPMPRRPINNSHKKEEV